MLRCTIVRSPSRSYQVLYPSSERTDLRIYTAFGGDAQVVGFQEVAVLLGGGADENPRHEMSP